MRTQWMSAVALSAMVTACASSEIAEVERAMGTEDAGAASPDAAFEPPDATTPPSVDAGVDAWRDDETADAAIVAADAGPSDPPPDCEMRNEVVVYDQSAWGVLADAFRDDSNPCAEYWFSIPALAGDKTMPRAGSAAADMRARGARFHAAAEFHWHGWAAVPGSWYDKGVEFRRRMEAAGYDVGAGDTWAINELPSSARREATVRRNVRDVVRGLYDGPPGATPAEGIVFVIGMGHRTTNLTVYKPQLETWLTDEGFWRDMDGRVRFWGQEVYADPMRTCQPGASTGLQSMRLNEYTMHVPRLAVAGGGATATARDYLRRAYVPVMNAVWQSDVYQTMIPLEPMQHFVSQQTYAARAWAGSHLYPDGRIGFAWARYDVPEDGLAAVARRLASAVRHAYGNEGTASHACSPSGAYTWCRCQVSGATLSTAWGTFDRW